MGNFPSFSQHDFSNSNYVHSTSRHLNMRDTYIKEANDLFDTQRQILIISIVNSAARKQQAIQAVPNFLKLLQNALDTSTADGDTLQKSFDIWKSSVDQVNAFFDIAMSEKEKKPSDWQKTTSGNTVIFTRKRKNFKGRGITKALGNLKRIANIYTVYAPILKTLSTCKEDVYRNWANKLLNLANDPTFVKYYSALVDESSYNIYNDNVSTMTITVSQDLIDAVRAMREKYADGSSLKKYISTGFGWTSEKAFQQIVKNNVEAGIADIISKGFNIRAEGHKHQWTDILIYREEDVTNNISELKLNLQMKQVLSNLSINTKTGKPNKYSYVNRGNIFDNDYNFTPVVAANLYNIGTRSAKGPNRPEYLKALYKYIFGIALKDFNDHAADGFIDIVSYSGTLYWYCDFVYKYLESIIDGSNIDSMVASNLVNMNLIRKLEDNFTDEFNKKVYEDRILLRQKINNNNAPKSFDEWEYKYFNIKFEDRDDTSAEQLKKLNNIANTSLSHALWQLSKNGK